MKLQDRISAEESLQVSASSMAILMSSTHFSISDAELRRERDETLVTQLQTVKLFQIHHQFHIRNSAKKIHKYYITQLHNNHYYLYIIII